MVDCLLIYFALRRTLMEQVELPEDMSLLRSHIHKDKRPHGKIASYRSMYRIMAEPVISQTYFTAARRHLPFIWLKRSLGANWYIQHI